MGCDIHAYGEKKVDGKWVCLDEFKEDKYGVVCVPYEERVYTGRNYELFGVLAGVRRPENQQFKEKGLPDDVSEEIKKESDNWGCDGHSHSYLTLSAIEKINYKKIKVTGMKQRNELQSLLEELKKESPDYDKLYPYCQGTNQLDYEAFSVMIPLSYLISDFTERVDKYFSEKASGSNNEDLRIVFWFDN